MSNENNIFDLDSYKSEIRRKLHHLAENDRILIEDLLYILPDLGFFESEATIREIDSIVKSAEMERI